MAVVSQEKTDGNELRGNVMPMPQTIIREKWSLPLWMVIAGILVLLQIVDSSSPSGGFPALTALGLGLACVGIGELVLLGFMRARATNDYLLLTPGIGIIVTAAVSQFAANLNLSLIVVLWGIFLVGLLGLLMTAREVVPQLKKPVTLGVPIVLVVWFITLAYFLPVAIQDGVPTSDGGKQWLDADNIFHEALVSTISTQAVVPPVVPNYSQQVLTYHYGRHALAAALVQGVGWSSSDALFRVVQPLGVLGLLGAVFCFGRWTSLEGIEPNLTGWIAVLFVFFLSAPYEILRFLVNLLAQRAGALGWLQERFSNLPGIGYQVHLIAGSGLWGGIVLFVVAALLIRTFSTDNDAKPSPLLCGVIAACGICLNLLAGLPALLLVCGMYVCLRGAQFGTWVRVGILCFVGAAVLVLGGILNVGELLAGRSSPPAFALLNALPADKLIEIYFIFTLALGYRLLAFLTFAWGSAATRWALALVTVGYLVFYLLVRGVLRPEDGYAIIFWSMLLAGFAAAPSAILFVRFAQRRLRISDEMNVAAKKLLGRGAMVLIGGGLIVIALLLGWVHNGIMAILVIAIIGLVLALRYFRERLDLASKPFRVFSMLFATLVLVLSLSAWIAPVLNFGWNGRHNFIIADAGRIRSLVALEQNSAPNAVVATSHQRFPGQTGIQGESVLYAALSQRSMLLESTQYFNVELAKNFEATRTANETLFTTPDAETAKNIVMKFGIDYILTEPNETLGFDALHTTWLKPISNNGNLGIWQVIPSP